jgi:hypothetical protein
MTEIIVPPINVTAEVKTAKIWRWLTTNGDWGSDIAKQKPKRIYFGDGSVLNLAIKFDRTSVRKVDVFQVWLFNLRSETRKNPASGTIRVVLNGKRLWDQVLAAPRWPRWGTSCIINLDETHFKDAEMAKLNLGFKGDSMSTKSLEYYSVMELL